MRDANFFGDKAINDKNCFMLQKLHFVVLIVVGLVRGNIRGDRMKI